MKITEAEGDQDFYSRGTESGRGLELCVLHHAWVVIDDGRSYVTQRRVSAIMIPIHA